MKEGLGTISNRWSRLMCEVPRSSPDITLPTRIPASTLLLSPLTVLHCGFVKRVMGSRPSGSSLRGITDSSPHILQCRSIQVRTERFFPLSPS